jgi:biopolymer transport protein ExbB/TolQ
MKWIDFLAWFFVIGVFLSWSVTIFIGFKFKQILDSYREFYREILSELRNDYRNDTKDLLDRLMASSYSEYEAYKEEGPKKPKPTDNFIKRSIDQAEQNYIRERQGLTKE